MRFPSDKLACPSRRTPSTARIESGCRQSERGGKGYWDAEHANRDWPGGGTASIASQSLLKAETIPRTLGAREDDGRCGWRSGGRWRQAHLQALVPHELQAGTPMDSAAPVMPEERGSTYWERMQEDAHLTGLRRSTAIPLTLLA